MIDLRLGDVGALVRDIRASEQRADLVMADPPWEYQNATIRGGAFCKYDCLTMIDIARMLADAATIAHEHAYMGIWCTFPHLEEWLWTSRPYLASGGWTYVTGGTWGKTNGLGVGIHFRGDSELLLLYRKGNPKPQGTAQSNLWLAPRVGHSEKPQRALRALVGSFCPPGGLVVDLYAGASASLARACRATGRRYAGAELDPARHNLAMLRLSQQEIEWGA